MRQELRGRERESDWEGGSRRTEEHHGADAGGVDGAAEEGGREQPETKGCMSSASVSRQRQKGQRQDCARVSEKQARVLERQSVLKADVTLERAGREARGTPGGESEELSSRR